MKRSKAINLSRMRKGWQHRSKLAPSLAMIAAGGSLTGCGEDAEVFSNLADCSNRYPLRSNECQFAYDRALQQATRYGPRYPREGDCEYDFGNDSCEERSYNNRVWFMPRMSGFAMLDRDYRSSTSLFTSKRRGSVFYKKWVNSSGHIIGKQQFGPQTYSSSDLNPKPSNQRVFGRGGFGKLAASKVRSGGSFSRGG